MACRVAQPPSLSPEPDGGAGRPSSGCHRHPPDSMACRSPPARPVCAPHDSMRTGLRDGLPSDRRRRPTTRRRPGAGLRGREVGARRPRAGIGRRRRRRGDRVARGRALVAHARHAPPAARPRRCGRSSRSRVPRIMQRAATRHRQLELDRDVYARARELAEAALAGGASLSREELFAAWESAGIRTAGQRGYHLIWWLAHEAVVCCGPVEGRGQRFVLLDEWAPSTGRLPDRDETLANLFVAYAAGHGPVTVRDFAWWSGLTLTDARTAFAAAGDARRGLRRRARRRSGCRLGRRSRIDHAAHVTPLRARRLRRVLPRVHGTRRRLRSAATRRGSCPA